MPQDEPPKSRRDETGLREAIPLAEERLVVARREVEGERVRVRLRTEEESAVARLDLRRERIEIERVPIGREVECAPAVREEDGVTIVPVLEEVLVVRKQLVLKEELHIRRVASVEVATEPVTLRRQHAEVERLPPGPAGAAEAGMAAATGEPQPGEAGP